MIEESLKTYRQERKAFILGLKHYYGIDFYQIDTIERKEWLQSYIKSKRNFFENLLEHWEEFPPNLSKIFPEGYFIDKKKGEIKPRRRSFYESKSRR